jgi:hypothetical protein
VNASAATISAARLNRRKVSAGGDVGRKAGGRQAELLEHDVNKARELLAEAGYPNGEGFP